MRMMLCVAEGSIELNGGPSVQLIPGVEYDLDRVLIEGDAHKADFTVADAVQGKESEWFTDPPADPLAPEEP